MRLGAIAFTVCVPASVALCISACSSSDDAGPSATSGSSSVAGASNQAGSAPTAGASSASGDAEPAPLAGITAAHNVVRANVTPAADPAIPPLVWSSTVAATAQAWADGCSFAHSGAKYGENIYAAAGSDSTPLEVVNSWAREAAHYDYAANSCSGTCGHYTQVVWRKSQALGCGVAKCSKNSPFSGFTDWQFWVCNYDPPGNFNDQKPY